jgi:hypothetical protein
VAGHTRPRQLKVEKVLDPNNTTGKLPWASSDSVLPLRDRIRYKEGSMIPGWGVGTNDATAKSMGPFNYYIEPLRITRQHRETDG